MVSSSFIHYYMEIIHENKNQESNLQQVSCPTTVLQPKPVQILPFSTRKFLLPLKVVLHFINDIFNYILSYSSKQARHKL